MIQLKGVKISRDLSFIYNIMTDYNESNFILRGLQINSFEEFETWFKNELKIFYTRFYIIQDDDQSVGFIYAYDYHSLDRTAKMSVYILPDYRDIGIGALATIQFLDRMFTEYNLKKIYSFVYGFNQKSYACNVDAGFVQEGCLKEDKYFNGKFFDMYIFAMYPDHFYNRYGTILNKTL